ncbi:MAG: T9SS type A sorting domain-containing protein, partial [Prevotella sp.]|nr:T9SS type A sorting domain-containing protein [Prevotella sp.]
GSLKCREPFPFHAFVSTSIIVHTSIGDFGAIGVDIDGTMLFSPIGNEWYYEIENENGSITYQYLYQAGDTIVQDEPTHILVKINTLYDKDLHQDVTHEYVYERDGKVYWWNKTLEEFTVLYDFGAHEGDSWVTKVGTETLTMHVDAEEIVEYEGRFYRMLHVSDTDDIFSGDIVCGIGHLTSFFPERLMDNGDGIRVEGLRCYWIEDELVFKPGDEDCDAIYDELHGIEEDGPSTGSGALTVYPNPTNGVLNISVRLPQCDSSTAQTYRITNVMGQTLLEGSISEETLLIDVRGLAEGMYFVSIGSETRKFVVNK